MKVFYVISVVSQAASIECMRRMSKPLKSDKQLIDAGLDLNLEGGFGECVSNAFAMMLCNTSGLTVFKNSLASSR